MQINTFSSWSPCGCLRGDILRWLAWGDSKSTRLNRGRRSGPLWFLLALRTGHELWECRKYLAWSSVIILFSYGVVLFVRLPLMNSNFSWLNHHLTLNRIRGLSPYRLWVALKALHTPAFCCQIFLQYGICLRETEKNWSVQYFQSLNRHQ